METKHTPWTYDGASYNDKLGWGFIIETGLEPGQHPGQIFINGDPMDEPKCEQIRYLVQAVNQHAALIAALEQAVAALEAAREVGEIKFGTCVLSRQVANQITAALDAAKKARG